MRILINAASAKMGGNVTYLQNVLYWLPRIAPQDEFLVYLPDSTRDAISGLSRSNLTLQSFPYEHTGGAARFFFDQIRIPCLVRRLDIDVLFSSTGFGTYFFSGPELLLVRNPVYFSEAFRQRYRNLGRSLTENRLRRWHSIISMKRANLVSFPTAAMRDMAAPYANLARERCKVLNYGYDPDTFKRDAQEPSFLPRLRAFKNQGYQLLLNVSTYAVHKNIETLIEALPRLNGRGFKVKLVTTTSREETSDKTEYDALRHRVQTHGVEENVEELGYVAPSHLHALYTMADVYVFPSFIESFGHTMVEAMGHGLPVVAADTPVNREVCGQAARYFNTFDPDNCAEQIAYLLTNERALRDAQAASEERSKAFSWKHYAQELMEMFRRMPDPTNAKVHQSSK